MNDNRREVKIGGKTIGEVTPDGSYQKRIRFSAHALRVPPAIAFSNDSLTEAKALGAVSLRVIDLDSGRVYQCSMEHFERHGFAVNRGYEPQTALRLEQWDVSGGVKTGSAIKALDSFEARQKAKSPAVSQLGLFG